MTSIGERIAQVIKSSGLSKTDFAAQMGLSQPYISNICAGHKTPSDRTIADICRVYRVNELWLRTGEGEPFVQVDEDQAFLDAIADITISNTRRAARIRKILRIYWDLPDEAKDIIDNFVRQVSDECTE